MLSTKQQAAVITKRFYKEKNIWYIDLPEFLEQGWGSKADLMMVAGADTFLDLASGNTGEVTIRFSENAFKDHSCRMVKDRIGMDRQQLQAAGHPDVEYGAYYRVVEFANRPFSHELWLCPVTEYVFGGHYPEEVYMDIISIGK